MVKKIIPLIIIVAVVVGGGAFFAGMKYGQSKAPRGFSQADLQGMRDLSPAERQQRLQQMGGGSGRMAGGQIGSGSANGEIIAKDEKSITVKLRDGGSKIVFFASSTEVGKFMDGTSNDLEIGKTVVVNGTAGQDGSIIAKSIQLRPEVAPSPPR